MKYGVWLALPCAVVVLSLLGATWLAADRARERSAPPSPQRGEKPRGTTLTLAGTDVTARKTAAEETPEAQQQVAETATRSVPPLSLEGFLDEKLPEAPEEKEALKADNFACYVCHANYETEELTLVHARAGIGCAKCHGPSLDHCDDEAHEIPPDIMFALDEIDAQCGTCHEGHDASAIDVVARYLQRVPAKTNPEEVVCTDCHGDHRLRHRSVWWDRETRELIVPEDGQPLQVRPDWSVPPHENPAPSADPQDQ